MEADIYNLSLSNRWLEDKLQFAYSLQMTDISAVEQNCELSDSFEIDDTERLDCASPCNKNVEHYSKQIEGLFKEIQRENSRAEELRSSKNSQLAIVEQYNELNRQIVQKNNLKNDLDVIPTLIQKSIDQLTEKITKLNRQLETQYQTNQELKTRLFDKEDHEIKETKNLRD